MRSRAWPRRSIPTKSTASTPRAARWPTPWWAGCRTARSRRSACPSWPSKARNAAGTAPRSKPRHADRHAGVFHCGARARLAAVAVAALARLHLATLVLRALLLLHLPLLVHLLALVLLHLPLLLVHLTLLLLGLPLHGLLALLLLHGPLLLLHMTLLLFGLALHRLLALLLLHGPLLLLHLTLLLFGLALHGLLALLLLRRALLVLHLPLLVRLPLHGLLALLLLHRALLVLHLPLLVRLPLHGLLALLLLRRALLVLHLPLLVRLPLHGLLALLFLRRALLVLHLPLLIRVPLHGLLALLFLRRALLVLHLPLLLFGLALLPFLHLPLLLEALALHLLRLAPRIGAFLSVGPLARRHALLALLFQLPLLLAQGALLLHLLALQRLLLLALHGLLLPLRVACHARLPGKPARLVGPGALATARAAPRLTPGLCIVAIRAAVAVGIDTPRARLDRSVVARCDRGLAHAHVRHRPCVAAGPALVAAAPGRAGTGHDPALARKAPGQVFRGRAARRARGDGLAFKAMARLRRQRPRRRSAHQAALDRCHRRRAMGLARRHVAPFGAMQAARGAPFDKIARRHAGDGAGHGAVDVRRRAAVAHHEVVDRHPVDARHVGGTGAIDRPVGVARPQRIPGHARPAACAHAPAGPGGADKGHQRRGIAWTHARPGDPAPARAHIGPAAIVRGREAPRRIVDPGPAPGRDPGPVAGAVRRPSRADHAREPDRAVARVFLPVAIAVQRGIARHLARHVARRRRSVFACVARRGPAVEGVFGHRAAARIGQVGAGKAHAVAALQLDRAAVAVDHRAAMAEGHGGGTAVGRHVQPVVARFARHEGQVRGIDLDRLARRQRAHAHLQRALRQLDLRGAVVQVQDAGGGGAAHAQRHRAGVQLGASARLHPEPVAGGHRPVQPGRGPGVRAGGCKAQAAFDRGQRGNARGRIGLLQRGVGNRRIEIGFTRGGGGLRQCSSRHGKAGHGCQRGQRQPAARARRNQASGLGRIGHGRQERDKTRATGQAGPRRRPPSHPIVTIHGRRMSRRTRRGTFVSSYFAMRQARAAVPVSAAGCGRAGGQRRRGGACFAVKGGNNFAARDGRIPGRRRLSGRLAGAASRSGARPASGARTGSPAPHGSHWPAGNPAVRASPRLRPPRRCAGWRPH
ncbi:membrane protein of unknown function (plasmid) [Cupriavidus taiwanensis]|nr:membrane protein of unknown function [Cupriavidus taiwanensis]SOZ10837.1 membrane protein of unknown function [Cupriavidus taiwanensis]SOZ42056.1 membrane protein of unknown function [Cupriavidus taiwanensis]SPD55340.1 membrane protein of unknown function [Cupriavidus taiwanensis]